jgi:hypothetical protein
VLSTAGGLVFQGNAGGSLSAYDARSGEQLWTFAAQTGVVAAPITYAVNGVQYVAIVAGWGGIFPLLAGELANVSGPQTNRSRVLAFRLDGNKTLPPVTHSSRRDAVAVELSSDEAVLNQGKAVYQRFCSGCHGDAGVSGGVLSDLRFSRALASAEAWRAIVLDGALKAKGMVGFSTTLRVSEAEAVRHYIAGRASQAR